MVGRWRVTIMAITQATTTTTNTSHASPKDEEAGSRKHQQGDAIGEALGEKDRRGAQERDAAHLLEEVALQPFAELAGSYDHRQAGEEGKEAFDLRDVVDADLMEVEVPLHEADEVVAHGKGEKQRQELPAEVAEAAPGCRRSRRRP